MFSSRINVPQNLLFISSDFLVNRDSDKQHIEPGKEKYICVETLDYIYIYMYIYKHICPMRYTF